jgi:hypothetical protein
MVHSPKLVIVANGEH